MTTHCRQVALVAKNPPASAGNKGDQDKDPPGGGRASPPQHSCLENPTDRGARWAAGHRVAQSWARLRA